MIEEPATKPVLTSGQIVRVNLIRNELTRVVNKLNEAYSHNDLLEYVFGKQTALDLRRYRRLLEVLTREDPLAIQHDAELEDQDIVNMRCWISMVEQDVQKE